MEPPDPGEPLAVGLDFNRLWEKPHFCTCPCRGMRVDWTKPEGSRLPHSSRDSLGHFFFFFLLTDAPKVCLAFQISETWGE